MIVICDESLEICHHNRAFLKGIGHSEGTFCGQNLLAFVLEGERDGVIEAFSDWRRGHAAGMRFLATFHTTKGGRSLELRAVRSRNRDGSYRYYLIARDAAETRRGGRASGDDTDSDPIFRGLPVAAWRTDGKLRIVQAYGSLWPDLGLAGEDLVGESLHPSHAGTLRELFPEIDCGDVLAGMAMQTSVKREDFSLQVSVEPFFDDAGRLLGTVGLMRRIRFQGRPVALCTDMAATASRSAPQAPRSMAPAAGGGSERSSFDEGLRR